MAKGDKEHQMLFDLRGKRRNVVKVVYATLAVLMGLSLFLVIGGFNIAELFNGSGTSAGNLAEPYEEQAERIEAKLKKDPENPDLLLTLTRANVNAGNAQVTIDDSGGRAFPAETIQQWERAYESWSEYLEAAEKPNPSLALLMSSTLLQLAELSRSYEQAEGRLKSGVEAQEIVAEQRPSVNSFSTLALYTFFTGDFEAAEKAQAKAGKMAASKTEREAIDKQLGEAKKRAEKFLEEKEQFERQQKALQENAGKAGGGALESPENPLGGALGGGGLSE